MTKRFLVTAILIVIAFTLSGCLPKKQGQTNTQTKPAVTEQKNEDGSLVGKIQDILTAGRAVKCTFGSDISGVKTSATTFVSGKKMRMDSINEMGGTKISYHLVSDGQLVYFWNPDEKQGMKIDFSKFQNKEELQDNPLANPKVKEWMGDYDYKCYPWIVDDKMFDPPSDVTFNDLTEFLNSMQQQNQNQSEE